ncbi:hypothetical protein HNP55_001004 [Paucibacter oligotrophus]|uniref:Uncharacterized protein n=1 Tax=Roseateles oligotrophus TaxID=1769250 RepID=A0A840L8M0_9BURK|nr:hypothetical protein [Roseateles oligotrophus]MBB4842489.1 hypothetical protein [Roseateles oligotrophus]
MSAALHKQLRSEALERRCKTTAAGEVVIGAHGGATGLALAALEASLTKVLNQAMPRSFMFEGVRYRVKVSELVAQFEVRDQDGQPLIDGFLPLSIK